MHSTIRTRRLTVSAAACAVLVLLLGACDQIAERATEEAVEKAAEAGAGEDVDVDLDGDGVKIESSDGSFTSGTGLPEDFPIEDIPIVGEVTFGQSSSTADGQGWSIGSTLAGAPEEALAEARSALEAVGFSTETEAAGTYVLMTGDRWDVSIGVGDDGSGGTTLVYTVVAVAA